MSDDWKITALVELLADRFSGAWGSDPISGKQETTVLRSTDIDDEGHVDLATGAKRSLTQADLSAKRLRQGDILLEASGGGPGKPVGRVAWFSGRPGEDFVTSNFFKVLRPKPQVHGKFLLWQLLRASSRPEIWHYQQQTTGIINLNFRDYLEQPVPLPASWEQQRVAQILDALDDQILTTEQIIAKLIRSNEAMTVELLTRGIDANGLIRDTEWMAEHDIDLALGPTPPGWEVGPLERFQTPDRPYLKTGPFGSSLKQEHWVDEGVPVITIGSLGDGTFIESELLHITGQTARSLSAYALEAGDIVFSRVADVGRSVVVGEGEQGWIMSSNMMWISLDQERADPHFVRANIAGNPGLRRQIRRYVNSAGRDVANAQVMNLLQFPWPPIEEQKAIASRIAAAEKEVAAQLALAEKLRLLKHGLMSDLLTGRVRVPAEARP